MNASIAGPSGSPTFVFTDVESSTALWEAVPEAMTRAIRAHDAMMREVADATGGYEVKAEGDAFMLAYAHPDQAIRFAQVAQETLARMNWPEELENHQREKQRSGPVGLRVRMGIHHGKAERRANPHTGRSDYFGGAVNIAARLSDMAHGAQVLVSEATMQIVGEPDLVVLRPLGPVKVRGLEEPVPVVQMVTAAWWPIVFPPLRLGRVAFHSPANTSNRGSLTDQLISVADGLYARAQSERLTGRIDAAQRDLNALGAVVDWLDDDERRVECLAEKAALARDTHDEVLAIELIDEALAQKVVAEGGFRAFSLHLLRSESLRVLERFDEARRSAQAALAIAWQREDVAATAEVRGAMAELDRLEGRHDVAFKGFRAALGVLEDNGAWAAARKLRYLLGVLLVEQGNADGRDYLEAVEADLVEINATGALAAARINLALFHLDQGNDDDFLRCLALADEAFDHLEHAPGRAMVAKNLICFHLRSGRMAEARGALRELEQEVDLSFSPGADLEGAMLRTWLLLLERNVDEARKGLDWVENEARNGPHLLGPMAEKVATSMRLCLDGLCSEAVEDLVAGGPPKYVTLRVMWRELKAYAAAQKTKA